MMKINYIYLPTKAIHNKDYSVVKTFKAGQLAFINYKILLECFTNSID